MKSLVAAALLAVTPVQASTLTALGLGDFNPSLPVFGGGSFVNVFDGQPAAIPNAATHVAFALGIPLAGQYVGGRRGLWIAGLSWMAFSLSEEALFHAPRGAPPNPAYPSEVRADLLTRIVPTALLLGWDLLHARSSAPVPASDVPRGPLRAAREPPPRSEAAPRWMCLDVQLAAAAP